MTEQQKRAATGLSLGLVTLAAAFVVWLAAMVARHTARGDEIPGSIFLLIISSWAGLKSMLAALPALVSVGLAAISRYKLTDRTFYAIIAISVVGLAGAVFLFLAVKSPATAQAFFEYSNLPDIQEYETFVAASQLSLGVISTWFLATILLELGIKRM